MRRVIPNQILILIILFKLILSDPEKFKIEDRYMKIIELQNGNFLLCTENGIYLNRRTSDDYPIQISIENPNTNDFSFVTAAQFEEGDQYVVILYKNMIYIFSKEGKHITNEEINLSAAGEYYSLILYKIEENNDTNNYYFFICYIVSNGDSRFKIAEYYFNSTKVNLSTIKYLKPLNYSQYLYTEKGFSCEIMNLNNNENVLTCFFFVDHKLVISSFDLNNFEAIYNKLYETLENIEPIYIHSGISKDKSYAIICYIKNWNINRCDKYKIKDNSLNKITENNFGCANSYPSSTFLYTSLSKNNFISGCLGHDKKYNLIIFDSDFDIQNVINFTKSNCNNTALSVLESLSDSNKYSMVVSCDKEGIYYYADLPEGIKYNKTSHRTNSDDTDEVKITTIENTFSKTTMIAQNSDEEYIDKITIIPSTEYIKNESCPIEYLYQNMETKECLKSCTASEISNHVCKINFVTNDNINNFTENIRNMIKEENITSEINLIIEGTNTIYQIISSEKMNENENTNISIIDLGDCEKKLKSEYVLDYLLIMKIDTKLDSNTAVILNYEIYDPYTNQKLNLSICSDIKINTYSSYYPSEDSMDKINQLQEYGYDLYNIEDPFYQDICASFTSENGTDILLSDRKSDFYENVSLCENDCVYKGYNIDSNRVKCECNIKQEITIEENNNNDDNLFQYMLSGSSFSNLKVLKCYNLVFSIDGIQNNKGSIIFICINCSMIILSIIYGVNQGKFISKTLEKITKKKYKENTNKSENINNSLNDIEINSKYLPSFPPKKKKRKAKKKGKKIVVFNVNSNSESHFEAKNQNKFTNEKIKERCLSENNYSKKKLHFENYNFTNEELNSLSYDLACKYDKRTYFQYYISLLKQKHLIFFTFFNFSDYNIFILKLSLFLSSFALYFAVNAVFFTDDTMHNIYKGDSGIISQISNIFYSTIISCFINIIIKKLGLSNDSMVKIKQNPDAHQRLKQTNKLVTNLKIKFGIFFIFSFLLISFFWYFITAFCAVYKNTQNILIENTFVSFTLSLAYPLGINLIPGILRIPSLKKSNKSSKYFYFISRIIAII